MRRPSALLLARAIDPDRISHHLQMGGDVWFQLKVDVAHDTGFGLVNPLSVKKQIEGQITWFYNDAMLQATTIADDTGLLAWATTRRRRSNRRSATPSSRSPESDSGTCRTANTI